MTAEFTLIDRYFRPLARDPAARGLFDDAAVLSPPPGRELVVTKDMIAQGVHFLADDPPATIGAKLLAVNLSDLAAMGATPLACLLGLGLPSDQSDDWVAGFAQGLGAMAARLGCPLIGGDTIAGLDRPVLSLTAFGTVAAGQALARGGARAGDRLWVSGTVGDAGAGLALLTQDGGRTAHPDLVARYRQPEPRLALGQALAGLASACADVSDGLLADAAHIASASGVGLDITLASVPVSDAWQAVMAPAGVTDAHRLRAATAGDDYELVFTAQSDCTGALVTLSETLGLILTEIGVCSATPGVRVRDREGQPIEVTRLGFEHGHGPEGRTEEGCRQD